MMSMACREAGPFQVGRNDILILNRELLVDIESFNAIFYARLAYFIPNNCMLWLL